MRLLHFHNDTPVTSGRPHAIAVATRGVSCPLADPRAADGPQTRGVVIGGIQFIVWDNPPARLRELR